jgi:hypothetical protein
LLFEKKSSAGRKDFSAVRWRYKSRGSDTGNWYAHLVLSSSRSVRPWDEKKTHVPPDIRQRLKTNDGKKRFFHTAAVIPP